MSRTQLKITSSCIPDAAAAAKAAGRGVLVLVRRHLRAKNAAAAPRAGFPKTDYWADAAESATADAQGAVATVTVEKEGAALHYYGGRVSPRKKSLAIPIDPAVAGIWPSEYSGGLELFWPKSARHGFLKDEETRELLYLLIPHADIPADPTVLPTEEDMAAAALDAILDFNA